MQNARTNYILYSMMFVSAALMTVISPMLSELAREFGLSLSESGLMYTAEFTGFVVFILLGGILADKFGKRIVLTVVFIVLIVSLYAFSLSQNFYLSLVIMIFAGGFCGPLESITIAAISDANPIAPDKHINIASIFYGLGAMTGPVAAGLCLTYGVSWRTVYIGLSITCALLMIVSFLAAMPKTESSGKISFKAFKNILKDRRFVLVCVCIFLYCGAEGSAWGWMSEYMKENLGFAVLKSSLAIGAFWLAIVLGRLASTRVMHRVSSRVIIGVLSLTAAVVTFISAFVSSEVFAWIITFLMGFFYSSQWPVMVGQASGRHKQYSGTSIAILVSSGGIALAVVPALLGVVADNFGTFVAQILPAFFFIILFVLYSFATKPEKE